MKLLILDKRDLENQIEYIRSLLTNNKKLTEVRSYSVKQLLLIKMKAQPLEYGEGKICVDKEMIEQSIENLQLNSQYKPEKRDINNGRIAQLNWILRNSEEIVGEESKGHGSLFNYVDAQVWTPGKGWVFGMTAVEEKI